MSFHVVIGPITLVVYEDPEDSVPKIHVRCENYMAWMQEQNFPLHLHVQKNKKIMFDQVLHIIAQFIRVQRSNFKLKLQVIQVLKRLE